MKTHSICLAMGLALLVCSCSKPSHHNFIDNVDVTPQNIAGTYSLVGLSTFFNNSAEQDIFRTLDACAQDDTYSLRPNGSFTYNDVGLMCAGSTNTNGTWEVVDKHTMRIGAATYRVQHFNGKKLSLTADTTINGRKEKLIKKFLRK